ncbi:MAG TPA: LarC family nickel insertion protein, partial [Thermoanaerobaculia bacterium]|nr:LarC family nickel insertion protein [Thermoanaerobaculia bacterium]
MKTLFIDSVGGLAGDMFLAAALDAGLATLEELSGLVARWLPEQVRLESETVTRNEMRARTFRVIVDSEVSHVHEHRNLADVERLLDACPIPPAAVALAKTMFRELAAAEAVAHGIPEEAVRFHEVGATDSLVDFALAAFVVERLGARVEASPAVLGRGRVAMAHGDWPVPPPGTAEILRRGAIPSRSLPETFAWEDAELTTPTGACLLRLASRFGPFPAGVVLAVGVGAGSRDIPRWPNVTRLFVLETPEDARPEPAGALATSRFDTDTVAVLETWIDDTPGNVLALAVEEMLRAG